MRVLFINNSVLFHTEIIESVIVKYKYIIKKNIDCEIYLKQHCKDYETYIKAKYPNLKYYVPKKYNFFIEITLYAKNYYKIKNRDKDTHFYISHDVNNSIYNYASNIYFLTPIPKYNFFHPNILPFSNIKIKRKYPIYIIQGNLTSDRKNYNLLKKILNGKYNYKFKIRMIGYGEYPDELNDYKDKIDVLNNLDFISYHSHFCDCYCIMLLITYKSHPHYYYKKSSSSINYASAYKLLCLIDKKLQHIYNFKNVELFNDENDICNAFENSLINFYKNN